MEMCVIDGDLTHTLGFEGDLIKKDDSQEF
jgi:hypothetical protein